MELGKMPRLDYYRHWYFIGISLLALLLLLTLNCPPGMCDNLKPTPKPATRPKPRVSPDDPNLLYLMPSAQADEDSIDKTIKELHGTILGTQTISGTKVILWCWSKRVS